MTTVADLITELKKHSGLTTVTLVIDDGPAQMVCSGPISVEPGNSPTELLLAGEADA